MIEAAMNWLTSYDVQNWMLVAIIAVQILGNFVTVKI